MSIERTCAECKYSDFSATEEPCVDCDGPDCRFKPKEEGMGEKTYTMTFTTAKIDDDALKTITGETEGEDDLQAKLDGANEKIKDLQDKVDSARLLCAWKNGEIEGLHYAIRHFAKGTRKK